MVQRYTADEVERQAAMYFDTEWVFHSDYLILQAALKEALEGWAEWYEDDTGGTDHPRIAELRKLI